MHDGRMKTLHVMRHAKSRRDNAKLEDHARPLSPRGIEDGMAVAEHCAKAGIQPDLILCSSAVRTRANRSPTLASVMVIGHNDDLHEFAKALVGSGDSALRERLQGKFPTAALASFSLASPSWRHLGVGAGALVGYVTPKDLHC